MPPLAGKGKGKAREGRRSRSRNTTPSSVLSGSTAVTGPSITAYLDTDTSKLFVFTFLESAEILERLGTSGSVLDPTKLQSLLDHVMNISQTAESRSEACDQAMRKLQPKIRETEQEETQERLDREAEQRKAKLKKDMSHDDEDDRGHKAAKVKKGKERSNAREERPLTHGAHGVARQDGLDVKSEGQLFFCRAFAALDRWPVNTSPTKPPSQMIRLGHVNEPQLPLLIAPLQRRKRNKVQALPLYPKRSHQKRQSTLKTSHHPPNPTFQWRALSMSTNHHLLHP